MGLGFSFQSGGRSIRVERFDAPGRSGAPTPAVLLLHGADGASAHFGYSTAAHLIAAAGYHVFMPHYFDRTGEVRASFSTVGERFPVWAATVREALGAIGREPGVDPRRLGIVGVSLGAALGMVVAAGDERVRAFVDYFGFVPDTLAAGGRRLPPTLILHGARDAIVPVANARKLQAILERDGVAHEIAIYPDQGHGLFGAAQFDAGQRTASFLAAHLAAAPADAAGVS